MSILTRARWAKEHGQHLAVTEAELAAIFPPDLAPSPWEMAPRLFGLSVVVDDAEAITQELRSIGCTCVHTPELGRSDVLLIPGVTPCPAHPRSSEEERWSDQIDQTDPRWLELSEAGRREVVRLLGEGWTLGRAFAHVRDFGVGW